MSSSIDSNLFCVSMFAVVLTSECLNTLCRTSSRSCYNAFVIVVSVSIDSNIFCVRVTTSGASVGHSTNCCTSRSSCFCANILVVIFTTYRLCTYVTNVVVVIVGMSCSGDFFCVCMRSIILTSEGLYALSFATGSCCNFACIPCVAGSSNVFSLCVSCVILTSECLNALALTSRISCYNAIVPVVIKSCNFFLCNENFVTNGAVLTFGFTCGSTSRSNSRINCFGMTESVNSNWSSADFFFTFGAVNYFVIATFSCASRSNFVFLNCISGGAGMSCLSCLDINGNICLAASIAGE